jgi:hypothetical protein
MFESGSAASLDTVAHIIQVALTPIFLLSGLAALLGVFSTRLGHVADQVDQLANTAKTADDAQNVSLCQRLSHLHRRSLLLDFAVVLGAIGATSTCISILTLFVGALRNSAAAEILFLTFGLAIFCTIMALAAFVIEMLMASRGLRAQARKTTVISMRSRSKQGG